MHKKAALFLPSESVANSNAIPIDNLVVNGYHDITIAASTHVHAENNLFLDK